MRGNEWKGAHFGTMAKRVPRPTARRKMDVSRILFSEWQSLIGGERAKSCEIDSQNRNPWRST